jgi:hypothetical protein
VSYRADRHLIDLMLAHVSKDKTEGAYNRALHIDRWPIYRWRLGCEADAKVATMARHQAWFVTYKPVGSTSRKGYRRSSKQFASEQDAKAFAKDRLAEGSEITAGTLNPHSPKRFIGAARILDWLNE